MYALFNWSISFWLESGYATCSVQSLNNRSCRSMIQMALPWVPVKAAALQRKSLGSVKMYIRKTNLDLALQVLEVATEQTVTYQYMV